VKLPQQELGASNVLGAGAKSRTESLTALHLHPQTEFGAFWCGVISPPA